MTDTVIAVLERISHTHRDRAALRFKRQDQWESLSWGEYFDEIIQIGKGLMRLGLEPGEGVVIQGNNCPRWALAHFGSIAAGAVPAGIYANNTPDQCAFITNHCEAVVAFVENEHLLGSFLENRAKLPRLRHCVLMEGDHPDPAVMTWQELLHKAANIPTADLESRLDAVDPQGICELIYTSGTTGEPKGVILTHRNVIWTANRVTEIYDIGPDDSLISYLPLSHIAEQALSLYAPAFTGACVWFAESLDKVAENLREVRPSLFFAVPRVWEKIQARMALVGAQRTPIERWIAVWARRQGLAGGYAEQQGRSRPLLYGLAERVVFAKVRQRLGLDRARHCFTAAAPISLHTLEFFLSLGIPILEIYGMSENSGPATLSTRDRYRTGKAGRPMEGAELKIEPDGEICMRGPHISPGYFKDPEATRETFDQDGWLHSGDIGAIDSEGYLTISDRKKELIITSGGKNVAPQALESELHSIEAVGQAVVIGDRQKYLTALLTLDPDALPRVADRIGSPARDLASAAACPRWRQHLEAQVHQVNKGLARFETIKRFAILPTQLSVEGGELTPTMKLKRRVINEKYAAQIEELYR
jgi:long-subunit acyl-CoA synthetase (AMP-forming)